MFSLFVFVGVWQHCLAVGSSMMYKLAGNKCVLCTAVQLIPIQVGGSESKTGRSHCWFKCREHAIRAGHGTCQFWWLQCYKPCLELARRPVAPIRCWGMQTSHSSMDLFTLPQKKEIVLFLLVLCNSLKIPLKKCNFELSLVFSSIDCFNSYVMVQNDILKSNTGIWLFFRDLIQSWLPWWCF